jgi:DNA modification methylase
MKPYYSDRMLTVMAGDCRAVMAAMEPESVQSVVTSPPYFGLRDYGIEPSVWGGEAHEHEWATAARKTEQTNNARWQHLEGGNGHNRFHNAGTDPDDERVFGTFTTGFCPCGAWLGVLGLEPTVGLYVAHMTEVFQAVRRVLRKDGTVWLNLGDSYATAGGARAYGSTDGAVGRGDAPGDLRRPPPGLKPKDRMMVPARVALALQADGWFLRDEIVWAKPNPMPSSVTDRTTPAHEMVYLLTRSARYFYDAEAVREDVAPSQVGRVRDDVIGGTAWNERGQHSEGGRYGRTRRDTFARDGAVAGHVLPGQSAAQHRSDRTDTTPVVGRNKRSVWRIATAPYPDAHFATFPPKLIEPMILAGTSERGCCPECGAPWERIADRDGTGPEFAPLAIAESGALPDGPGTHRNLGGRYQAWLNAHPKETTGWRPTCKHDAEPIPCTVLDPFGGSGTVGQVSRTLGRKSVLIDLSPDYCGQMLQRATARWDREDEPVADVPAEGLWTA